MGFSCFSNTQATQLWWFQSLRIQWPLLWTQQIFPPAWISIKQVWKILHFYLSIWLFCLCLRNFSFMEVLERTLYTLGYGFIFITASRKSQSQVGRVILKMIFFLLFYVCYQSSRIYFGARRRSMITWFIIIPGTKSFTHLCFSFQCHQFPVSVHAGNLRQKFA